jgi:D-cysteine desulfhydrase
MVNILADIDKKHCNAVVSTGGIQSNHCRVVALACSMNHWKCKLVLHGSKEQFFSEKGNALLMRMADAQLEFVPGSQIGPAMDQAMEEFIQEGLAPYYLYGGGHNRAGTLAYSEAMQELRRELPPGCAMDHIFLASGTGSTQAGVLAGCREIGWDHTRVHGISVARSLDRGIEAISESLAFLGMDSEEMVQKIEFYDAYTWGGYGKYTRELQEFLLRAARDCQVVLDTTYSGKAFYGMVDIIKKQQLTGNMLFWHTGGIFNLMA